MLTTELTTDAWPTVLLENDRPGVQKNTQLLTTATLFQSKKWPPGRRSRPGPRSLRISIRNPLEMAARACQKHAVNCWSISRHVGTDHRFSTLLHYNYCYPKLCMQKVQKTPVANYGHYFPDANFLLPTITPSYDF